MRCCLMTEIFNLVSCGYDDDLFAEEETVTIQVKLMHFHHVFLMVSCGLKQAWVIVVCRVDDDTKVGEIAHKLQERQALA